MGLAVVPRMRATRISLADLLTWEELMVITVKATIMAPRDDSTNALRGECPGCLVVTCDNIPSHVLAYVILLHCDKHGSLMPVPANWRPRDRAPLAPRAALAMANSKAYQTSANAPGTLRTYKADPP